LRKRKEEGKEQVAIDGKCASSSREVVSAICSVHPDCGRQPVYRTNIHPGKKQ
jgi:hypothetical protein